MKKAEAEAKSALAHAADEMARYYDAHRQTAPEYEIGDLVWLDSTNIKTTRPMKKFDDKWFGPFPITKIVSRAAVKLSLPAQMKIHPVFSVTRLRPFIPDRILERQQPPPPPPDLAEDGTEEYELEKILDSRRVRRRLLYLCKFKGYTDTHNEWIPARDISAEDLITDFHRLNPKAVR